MKNLEQKYDDNYADDSFPEEEPTLSIDDINIVATNLSAIGKSSLGNDLVVRYNNLMKNQYQEVTYLQAEIKELKAEVERLKRNINGMITIEEFQGYFPSQKAIKNECEDRYVPGILRTTWYEAIIWLIAEMQKNVKQPSPNKQSK